MSTTHSRSGRGQMCPSGRRQWAVAALCALLCAGDLARLPVMAQPPAPAKPAEAAPLTAPANQQDAKIPSSPLPEAEGKNRMPPLTLEEQLARKGRLTVREATLADCMLLIQRNWTGLNILYDNDALQRVQVTGNLEDKSLKDILDTILPQHDFGYRRQGETLVILPLQELGEGADPNQKKALINMEFVNPQEVEQSVKLLMSPKGKVYPVPSAKAMMIVDYPDNIQSVREHIEGLDQLSRRAVEKTQEDERRRLQPNAATQSPGSPSPLGSPDVQPVEQMMTTVLWPKFVLAESIVEAITSQVADGSVTPITDMNALVVTGTESAVRAATLVLKQLDVPKKQVRISVLMYDIRVGALEQLGVNWRNAGKGRLSSNGIPRDVFDMNSSPMPLGVSSTTTSTGSSASSGSSTTGGSTGSSTSSSGATTGTSTTTTAATPGIANFLTSATPNIVGSALTLTHLSRHFDLSGVIMALDQTDGARLLANPSILCYDRKQSQTKIISEIPVQQLTQTEMGGNIGTTTFREAGVTVKVTPWIGEDGLILLDLAPEFSVLTGYQNGQPIIDRRTLTQWVKVQSGDTLVLGGQRRQNQLETVSGIPGLMNLKYVGLLFRSHRTTTEESELVTFIHTEIVDTDYKGLLREQVAAQVVQETMDRIPIAGHSPYVPPCNDPYCPIHNPRPKYWQGSMLAPDSYTPGHRAGAPPYIQPDYSDRALPIENSYPSPHDRPAPEVVPAPAPQADEPTQDRAPMEPPSPPPVNVDETARRMMGSRLVLFRLPKVTPSPSLQRLPQVPGDNGESFAPRIATRPLDRTPPVTPPAPTSSAGPAARGGWKELLR